MLTVLHKQYLEGLSANGMADPTYLARSLEEKLLCDYKGDINIEKVSNKLGKVVFSNELDINEAYALAQEKTKCDVIVEEAAEILRTEILKLKTKSQSLPFPLCAADIGKGETKAPEILLNFFRKLYTGTVSTTSVTDQSKRLIESVSDDVIYAVTNGQLNPSKHCLLGLGMNRMTGSRKVIDTLNKFGHSLGYHVAEELETDIALMIADKQQVTPDGMTLKPGLSTGIAFDNYDENT